MRFLPLTLPTPASNLAHDEALLLRAEAGEGGEVWPIVCHLDAAKPGIWLRAEQDEVTISGACLSREARDGTQPTGQIAAPFSIVVPFRVGSHGIVREPEYRGRRSRTE